MNIREKILVIEDEKSISRFIAAVLEIGRASCRERVFGLV